MIGRRRGWEHQLARGFDADNAKLKRMKNCHADDFRSVSDPACVSLGDACHWPDEEAHARRWAPRQQQRRDVNGASAEATSVLVYRGLDYGVTTSPFWPRGIYSPYVR